MLHFCLFPFFADPNIDPNRDIFDSLHRYLLVSSDYNNQTESTHGWEQTEQDSKSSTGLQEP